MYRNFIKNVPKLCNSNMKSFIKCTHDKASSKTVDILNISANRDKVQSRRGDEVIRKDVCLAKQRQTLANTTFQCASKNGSFVFKSVSVDKLALRNRTSEGMNPTERANVNNLKLGHRARSVPRSKVCIKGTDWPKVTVHAKEPESETRKFYPQDTVKETANPVPRYPRGQKWDVPWAKRDGVSPLNPVRMDTVIRNNELLQGEYPDKDEEKDNGLNAEKKRSKQRF